MEIGSVIREKRTAQGLTQEQVATALGVSAPAVSKWERGELAAVALVKDDYNTLLVDLMPRIFLDLINLKVA